MFFLSKPHWQVIFSQTQCIFVAWLSLSNESYLLCQNSDISLWSQREGLYLLCVCYYHKVKTYFENLSPKDQHVRLLRVLSASGGALTQVSISVNGEWTHLSAMSHMTFTLSEYCLSCTVAKNAKITLTFFCCYCSVFHYFTKVHWCNKYATDAPKSHQPSDCTDMVCTMVVLYKISI